MRVVVVGLGYVGSVCAACLSGRGHTVVGVDSSAFKADCIGRGESPIVETGLDALIAEAVRAGRPPRTAVSAARNRGAPSPRRARATPSRLRTRNALHPDGATP